MLNIYVCVYICVSLIFMLMLANKSGHKWNKNEGSMQEACNASVARARCLSKRLSVKIHDIRLCSLVRALCSLSTNVLYVNNNFWTIRDITSFKTTTGKNYTYVVCFAI